MSDLPVLSQPTLQSALALATEAGDVDALRDVRAMATALGKGARARGLGIDAENQAAEVVLRAERAIGQTLIALADQGLRAKGGGAVLFDPLRSTTGHGAQGALRGRMPSDLPTLKDLGINNARQAWEWQQVARLPDDQFEDMLEEFRSSAKRIAKINFYNAVKPKPAPGWREVAHAPSEEGGGSTQAFVNFRRAALALIEHISQVPLDEMTEVAALIKELANAYNVERMKRG